MKAGTIKVFKKSDKQRARRVHLTKAPKSQPKAANGLSHVVKADKPFRKTWHKDRTWKPCRRIFNLVSWLRKAGA